MAVLDKRAFELDCKNCRHKLITTAGLRFGIKRDDAEDLVQRTFIRMWRYNNTFDPAKSPFFARAWHMLVNLTRDDHKTDKAKVPVCTTGSYEQMADVASGANVAPSPLLRNTPNPTACYGSPKDQVEFDRQVGWSTSVGTPDPEDEAAASSILRSVLSDLGPTDRQCVILMARGLDAQGVASEIGVDPEYIYRLRKKLRGNMDRYV